jgi:integrase
MPRVHQFDADLWKNKRSLSMRRKVLTNMKTMLTFAQSQGLVAQNVARGVKIKDSERRAAGGMLRDGVNFPTRAELRTIMEQATGRWRPLIITAIFTGMRASELRGLLWKNVHLDEAVIHVRQRADAWGKLGNPKSKAGNRDIPLTPMVVNTLREWRSACPAGELGLVFPNTIGNVESQANVLSRFWLPLQARAGMITEMGEPKYTFHSLRHAAASLFIAHLGWTPKRVQAIMGHASVTMTFDRYGHLFEDRVGDREAMKKLEAAIVAA